MHRIQIRRRLASLLLVAIFGALPLQTNAVEPAFPRLANIYLHGYVNPDYIPLLSLYDVLIVDSIWTPEQLQQLRNYNPNIKIFVYVCNHCVEMTPSPTDAMKTENLQYAIQNDLWWYDKNMQVASDWPNSQMLNVTALGYAGPEGRYHQFLAAQIQDYVAARPAIDGVFLDNVWEGLSWNQDNLELDSDCNPTHNPGGCNGQVDDDATLDQLWNTAMTQLATDVRSRFDQLEANRQRPLAVVGNWVTDYYNLFNGTVYEFYPTSSNPEYGNQDFYAWSRQTLHPDGYLSSAFSNTPYTVKVNNSSWHGNFWGPYKDPGFEEHKRFSLCSTLLGDGYFSFDTGINGHGQIWWEQEYDHAGLGRGYLGQPSGAAFSVITASMPNLVANPAFTSGLTNWNTTAIGATGTMTVDNSTSYSAPSSIKLNVTAISQPLGSLKLWQTGHNVIQDEGYTVSFMAKSSNKTDAVIQLSAPGCPNQLCLPAWRVTLGTTWKKYEVSFIANATAAAAIDVMAMTTGTTWIDDVKFEAINRNAYRRNFQNGTVIVNYTNDNQTVQLGQTYYKLYIPGNDLFDGSAVSQVTVPPSDGIILVTDPPTNTSVGPGEEEALAAGPSTISFRLDRAQAVQVDLYDVTGRFVQRVVDERMMPAGVHNMTWDGRTSSGKRAASGVYFYRVTKASGNETRKLLLLR